jgi:hypothetical protein
VSILHVESFENGGIGGLLPKADASAGSVSLAVDFDAEEFPCQAEIDDLVLFREQGLNFDYSIDSVFWV